MSDLVGFLRARLDEDEAAALRDLEDPEVAKVANESVLEDESLFECLVITKGRVLREVEAKRRLVDLHEDYQTYGHDFETLDLLALPYADHPHYDPMWKFAAGR